MPMSWLIIMFYINGVPTVMEGAPPQLVTTVACEQMREVLGPLMAQAFPGSQGMVFCLSDNRNPEAPVVPA